MKYMPNNITPLRASRRFMATTLATFLALAAAFPLFTSCTEADSDLVSFADDNTLDTPNDTVHSVIGIVNKLQKIADRTVLLGELRGDLTALTANATLDLQAIANFTADASNPYNNARDYYAVIQNCNYFLANADTTLVKQGRRVFEKEVGVVKAYRAWTYLQLAINYGSVPFYTQPLLAEKDTNPKDFPFYTVEQMADFFVADLASYQDMDYPSYGGIGNLSSSKFYIPVRVILGDLCLWAGRYREAAKYYHDFLTKQGDIHPTYANSVSWMDLEFNSIMDSYASQFSADNSGTLSFIPMETRLYDGTVSRLQDIFNSTAENNYYYQATHSAAYRELSQRQQYTLVFQDPVTLLPDTIYASDTIHYDNDLLRGDLRLNSIYQLRNMPTASTTQSSLRQTCQKYRLSGNNDYLSYVVLYRVQYIYLRFAEALNRAGFPQAAFAVLKYGLWKDNIEKYIPLAERDEAGDLLSFNQYTFLRENTLGIHSRGSGDSNADSTYVIPTLATKADTILYVEDRICDEMALETAAEGQRFPDLMRLALHRNNPTFLAAKVAARNGATDTDLYTRLSDKKNWYLPLEE